MQLVVVAKLTSRAFVVGLVRRLVCILVGFERRCTAGVYPERQCLDLGVSRRRRRPMMLLRRLAALIIGDDNDLTTTTTITITTTTAVVMVVQRCDNDDAGSLEGGGGGGGEGEGRGIRTKRVVGKEGELSRHRHRRSFVVLRSGPRRISRHQSSSVVGRRQYQIKIYDATTLTEDRQGCDDGPHTTALLLATGGRRRRRRRGRGRRRRSSVAPAPLSSASTSSREV